MSIRPSSTPSIEAKQNEFMAMVGYCITDWAAVEEQLFGVFYDILEISMERAAIIYLRTPTLESRLSLLDEILHTAYPGERKNGGHQHKDLDVWDGILKEIRDLLPVRNRLAHSPIGAGIYGTIDDETDTITQIREIRVESSSHVHERARKPEEKEPLSIQDLTTYRPKISGVHKRLFEFRVGPLSAQLSKPR
jgi:hypothetical protein